ncbi:hypothetical protein [Streptomyces chattanoogensis]|uniref:hypothetical protein n=1 Tax=Streptomyces chattanoogensis TaxID=66876 RepID=UPI0036D1FD37
MTVRGLAAEASATAAHLASHPSRRTRPALPTERRDGELPNSPTPQLLNSSSSSMAQATP